MPFSEFDLEGMVVEGGGIDQNTSLKFNYINIPVMFKYYLTENFTFQTGP